MKPSLLFLFSLLTGPAWAQAIKPAAPSAGTAAVTATPAAAATVAAATVAASTAGGEKIYTQYCLTCHQASGSGVPKLNPPLKGTSWVLGDKTRLINVILKGLQNVDIDDDVYDNVMPAHDFLTDQQIADVLTYVRSHFGNQASAVLPDEVKTARTAVAK